MKKIIAFLTFTAVLCSFASCSQDNADEVTESSAETVTQVSTDIPQEETTESETAEETSDESSEPETEELTESEPDNTSVSETTENSTGETAEYQKVIEEFLECTRNKDIDGIIKLSYPDRYCDTIKSLYEMGIIYPPCLDLADAITFTNFTLVSIDSSERLAEDYISWFDGNYGQFQAIGDYISQNGTANADDVNRIAGEFQDISQEEVYFHVENAVSVTCMLSREPIDTSWYDDDSDYEKIIDYEFTLYYIDGEGWKIDFWFMPAMYQAEKDAAYQESDYIYQAAEIVLSEMETESENFIVSSDSSKNYSVSSEFADNFVNSIDKYYQKNDTLEYFVFVENGEISCVSGVYEGKTKSFSSFPYKYKYTEDDYIILSYEEDYQLCLDKIK